MNDTLTAEKGKVLEIYNASKNSVKSKLETIFGAKIFLPKVEDRIKNFDDVLKENSISRTEFEKSCIGLTSDEIAYKKAKLVCKAYNEDWIADWTDSSQYKYYPWFVTGSSSGVGFAFIDFVYWHTRSDVGSRLCFRSSELCKIAGKLFEQEIYKPLFT